MKESEYEIFSDDEFVTVNIIKEYFDMWLDKVSDNNGLIKISEDNMRKYITVSYIISSNGDNSKEENINRFSAYRVLHMNDLE